MFRVDVVVHLVDVEGEEGLMNGHLVTVGPGDFRSHRFCLWAESNAALARLFL